MEGDFRPFVLNRVVTFPTRGDRTLDQIFTNISSLYTYPSRLPPFGLSGHHSVLIEAYVRDKNLKPQYKTIKARDKHPSKRNSLGRFLLQVPWSKLLCAAQTCEQKVQTLTDVINYGLNTIMPEHSIRVNETDRPWISVQLKDLIACRQQALASGKRMLYKILRNKVNRERKRFRKTYYESKIGDLHDYNPRDWWREVKQICGTAKTIRLDVTSMLHEDLICKEPVFADNINWAFVNIMKDYQPLTDSVQVSVEDDEPITVTEELVEKKLRAISTSRASGPDELPNWVLKEYSDILAASITVIVNSSFAESCVPRIWKIADLPPIPKSRSICDYNKDLRPILLTATLSKVAESLVIDQELKPAIMSSIDPAQYGFI